MSLSGLLTIIIIIALAVAFWLVWTYNRLVRRLQRVEEAWADIEVQLKRRYNLIPNLVETVKGYVAHERKVLQDVTEARTRALAVQAEKKNPADIAAADNALASTLKTLFAVAENYPDLKANANFLDLQRELADTENKIQAARRFYNTVVREYNTLIHSLPTSLVAPLFHFSPREYFELAGEEERKVPRVEFSSPAPPSANKPE
jgi:LemA protein